MSYRNYALVIFVFAIFFGALLGASQLAPTALSSPQSVTNSNTKANKNQSVSPGNKNQTASPSRRTGPTRQGNSNTSTQSQSTANPNNQSMKKSSKIGESEKTSATPNTGPFQYVIDKVEVVDWATLAFKVHIRNTGGPAHQGQLEAELMLMTPDKDPKNASKGYRATCPHNDYTSGTNEAFHGMPILQGYASVPDLKSGQGVWVEAKIDLFRQSIVKIKSFVDFATQNTCGVYGLPVKDQHKYKYAISVKVMGRNQLPMPFAKTMANGQTEVHSGAWLH